MGQGGPHVTRPHPTLPICNFLAPTYPRGGPGRGLSLTDENCSAVGGGGGGVLAKQGDEVIYTDEHGQSWPAIVVHTDHGEWVSLMFTTTERRQRMEKIGENGLPFFLTTVTETQKLAIAPPADKPTPWAWSPIQPKGPLAAPAKKPTPPAGVA